MDPYYLTLVLYLILIYWLIVVVLDRKGILERYNISAIGPILMIRTLRGQKLLARLGTGELREKFWRTYANIGTILVLIALIFMFYLVVVFSNYIMFTVQPGPTKLNEPMNLLLIPGLNEFIPMCAWIGFVVALVVHELSHAVLGTVEKIKVKSMGLLVAVVPIGAFAELDNEQLFGKKEEGKKKKEEHELAPERDKEAESGKTKKVATARERTRILSAGVTGNFCVALIAFILFFGILFSIQPVSDTVLYVHGVVGGSPAEKSGIVPETFITKIDGSKAMDIAGMNHVLEEREEISFTVLDKQGKERKITVKDGSGREGVTIVWMVEGTPAANSGIKSGMVIIGMDNRSITNYDDFYEFMNHTLPGQEITVQTEEETFTVVLKESPYHANKGYLGVFVANKLLGMTLGEVTPEDYLEGLRSISSSFTTLSPLYWLNGWLILLRIPVLPFPMGFSSFNPLLSHFYEPVGAASFLGGSIFFIADVLFWIGWINLMVGLFNCLPAIPLDGGYVFREMLNSVLGIGIKDEKKKELISMVIVVILSVTILLSIIIMVVGPYLFKFFATG